MDAQGIAPPAEPNPGPRAGPAVTMDPWARFDRWAQNTLALLVLLGGLAYLLLVGAGGAAAPRMIAVVTVSLGLAIAPLVIVMLGLRRHRTWARPSAAVVLWAIVVVGAIELLSGLLVPTLTIPLGAILALYVLSLRPPVRLLPSARDARLALALGATYLMSGVLGGVSTFIASPPDALVAQRDDLRLDVSTSCGDPAFVPGTTDIEVTVVWQWTRRDTLPGIDDAFQVAWAGDGGLYPTWERSVVGGDLRVAPTGPAVTALDDEATAGGTAHVRYGLAGSSAQASAGSLRLGFAWDSAEDAQFNTFVVTWAHGRRWTTIASAGCEWQAAAGPTATTAP